jgi:tRNA threonylcarbamoyladenosine biosynthesis protein TsaE
MSVETDVASADAMHRLGVHLASVLRAGDLVVLVGPLGAGKTTLAQGIGAGLGVRGNVTSPTFVIARVHPTQIGGPALVHVDAYRIAGALEIDDLDLDASVGESVTIVEWGRGLVEGLASDRLDVEIDWAAGADGDTRTVRITPHGPRWHGVGLADRLATG